MESHNHDEETSSGRCLLPGLACHGFQSSATFQHTVTSYALAIPRRIARYLKGQRPIRVQILRDFNGLAKPGEMVLVLGRPGSGCSSLLKVLSGYAHGICIGEESKINYGGIPYDRMHAKFPAESLYLAELDAHFPELTLGETLTFVASTRELGSGSRTQSQANARDMGNAVIRGLSGGETRRTSIAEALMCGAQLQCWDNSTRGLDSATAQRFIDLLRMSTNAVRSTAIMSLYQAPDAMYNRFDKVTLLYQGRQIYFGPTASATQYFHELGFVKPERATVADFLTSLTNPAERMVRPGFEHRAPRSPSEFADAWKYSPDAMRLAEEITAFNSGQAMPEQHTVDSLLSEINSSSYVLPVHQQIRVCVQRGFDRLRNNYAPAVSTVFANGILAIVVGSVYYDLSETTDSMSRRSVLIFFSLMICAFSPAFELLTMWAQRPIVEKHHRYALYHPFTEAIASMICDLPTKLATSIVFHVTLYFMTNLRRTASAFFTHLLFMFFVVLTMSMVFRTIGSMSRTLEQALAPVSVMVLLYALYTGFVIPVPYMKPWLSWFRWLNPMSYVYESLMINEFNRKFPCVSTVPSGPGYMDGQGLSEKICPVVGAQPGEENVDGASYLRLTEYIPAQRSKGDVLLFQRNHQQNHSQIDGWVKPGTMTALMGVTGAGKTTLLDVLANRAAFGTTSGGIYIDGSPRDRSFQRKIGYVQQEDIHLPTATVREALEFSALLRQPGPSSRAERLGYVNNVIRMLDMDLYAEAVVGTPGNGLNIEQRKRLSIGVELVAKPELLLFLDEPTSGLDSQTAWSICVLLPVPMFDRLLLLTNRGETAYFGDIGPDASTLVDYFESRGATKCPPGANPAEWILTVMTSSNVNDGCRKISASYTQQMSVVTRRLFKDYWRDPSYLYSKLASCFLNGLSLYDTDLDMQGFTNFLFSIFSLRSSYLFEPARKIQVYSWLVFLSSNISWSLVADSCFRGGLCLVVLSTLLWQNGDESFGTAERGALVFVLIWLFCLWLTTFSQAVGIGLEHDDQAVQIATLFFWLSLVFCGVLVTPNQLPEFWFFLYRASPLTYFVNGIVLGGLANTRIECADVQLLRIEIPAASSGSTCGEYLGPFMQYAGGRLMNPNDTTGCLYCPTGHAWRNVGYLTVYVIFNTLAILGIYWFARGRKMKKEN
ncbi:ABC-2 type transporter-domain-containing protein [Stachybotrys elegans]|uniref:ABC-2 type transporter-domain-containing protein n=1 Tax=Stachybotrys elegans TaxID=80388 RepID=A0A8K0SHJ5_9HYPO|nr:ABC-2 type transporter-domain-containing protein [Stachybotrys elegans]